MVYVQSQTDVCISSYTNMFSFIIPPKKYITFVDKCIIGMSYMADNTKFT